MAAAACDLNATAATSLEAARADMTSSSELLEETARERDGLRAKANALEPFKPLAERLKELPCTVEQLALAEEDGAGRGPHSRIEGSEGQA